MNCLKLFLFGTPRLERDGQPLPLRRRKVTALLAYLATSQQPHSRDAVATMLWPEYDQSGTRANLRRDLSYLNKLLGENVLEVSRTEVGVNPSTIWLDVAVFREQLAHVESHCHRTEMMCDECAATLTEAIALAQGDFMAGFVLADSAEFDEWQFFQSEGLRQALGQVYPRLIDWHEAQESYADGVENARRWVALDPLHERAQRSLMRLYELAGQHAAALRQYNELTQLLQDELDAVPEPETDKLFGLIQAKRLKTNTQTRSVNVQQETMPPSVSTDLGVETSGPKPLRNNLPTQPTPFVGRHEELQQLDAFLTDSATRLLTVVGAGGMGKTRLALALADRQSSSGYFAHGIYFIALASVSEPDNIVPALAEALDFPLESSEQRRSAKQQILDYLRQKEMLLLLDNFEHLLEGAALVSEILSEAPDVRIIATAREKLSLQEEQLFPIQGLDFPDDSLPLTEETVEQYTAIQLFVQSAHRQQPDYSVGEHELPALSQICQLVNGMPLALELTASWVNMLSLSEIAQEIEESLDFLETTLRNVPDRHRSMRAVFDATWKRLASAERNVFAQLSIFRGGFTQHTAKEIVAISLPLLRSLVNKSLLVYSQSEARYQMHELLRQYGTEKLAREPAREHLIRDKHAAYFCNLLHALKDELKSSQQQRALATIEVDIDNIRTAWRWSVTQRHEEDLIKAVDNLGYFMQWQGRYQEGRQLFKLYVDDIIKGARERDALVLAKLQGWLGLFTQALDASIETSQPILLQALERLSSLSENNEEVRDVRAFINLTLGQIYLDLDLSTAESYLKGSEKLYAELGHQWEEAKIAEAQGHIERLRGNFELADTHLEKALSLYEQVGDPRSVVTTLEVLSTNTRHAGQLDRSTRFAEQCHALAIKNGNKPVLAKALTNLAFNCGPGLGNYDLGFVHQQKCVEIYEELGDSVNVAAAISRLGFYAAACGDFELGEEYLRRGLASLRETNSWYNVAWALQMLGFTLIARNQIKEAEKILLESKTTYQRLGAKDEALHGESRLIFTQRLYQNPKEIYRRLYEMLCTVLEKRMYYPIFGLLIVIAVVLSEQGYSDKKNQKKFSMLAIAVYEATDRNPTTSRLMLDVHGIAKPIYALLQAVPDKLARESQEQGKAMSIWQMAELLLEELPKLGWVKPQ